MPTQVVDLGFRPRKWQESVFLGLIRFSILVIHRGAGKTYLAILKLIDAALRIQRPMALYGYVAPELKQAKGIAWEILKFYALKVPGTDSNESELWVQFPNGARIQLFGADHYDSIRGRHFSGIVIDEVAQMKREVWVEVILPALANHNGWALFIGTPKGINLFSELYYQAIADHSWFHKKLTCYDTDVYSPEQLEVIKTQMGERAFRQEMLCDFMASTDNTLISLDTAMGASKRYIEERQRSFAPVILGVDVAHEGGDRCVIFPRQGLQAFEYEALPGLPEKTFWSKVATAIQKHKADACFVDTTGGYGGEVVSRLNDAGFAAMGVVFSDKPDNERFLNRRAEMWFKMAEWLREGSIPNQSALVSELCAPTYHNNNASMRLQLEGKKDIRERIGVSPDIADALAITFAYPVAPRHVDILGQAHGALLSVGREPVQSDLSYNPFANRNNGGSGPVQSDIDYNPFSRNR
jgi:phage terminase large subunit-like protein